jgi:ADP-dependent NAD(P)H-hydrate dehydratase / NAD(P)H-hydrate epimerase
MLVTAQQMRDIDKIAMRDYLIPGLLLMENAGRETADAVIAFARKHKLSVTAIGIICGHGNNGGDGFVAARYLYNKGCKVTIILIKPDKIAGVDALANLNIVKNLSIPLINFRKGINLKKFVIIVDAMLGTGIKGKVKGIYARAINLINKSNKPVISIDIPSGLDADTGNPSGVAVKADITVTMGFAKRGFAEKNSKHFTGKLVIADIGLPKDIAKNLKDGKIRIKRRK